jgi:hypothetical protein
MIYGWCIFLAYYSVAGLLFASAQKWGIDGFRKITLECYWWKFWRRLRALTEQLPRPVAFAGGFEVATGGSALRE